MKILVTGNLGYVGSHLTELLISSGHEVIGCDLSLFPDAICGTLSMPALQLNKDFRDLSEKDFEGIEAIAHLAGISNDPMGEINPGLTLKVNGEGSVLLAEKAKTAGVKIFVFASSCSIYGSLGNESKTEKDATNPLSEYASSKLFAEKGLSRLKSSKFHVYILRNATAYGASAVFRTDLVVNDLSSGIHVSGKSQIKSDGTPWRPLIHCRDMAQAFKQFIEQNPIEASGEPVNVGFNQENFQVKTIADIVQKNWEHGEIEYSGKNHQDPRNYRVNFDLLQKYLPNFLPEFPLMLGIQDLKKFLEKTGYSFDDYQKGRFIRITELKKSIEKIK